MIKNYDPICGNKPSNQDGLIMDPLIFDNIKDDDALATTELFAPVLSILEPYFIINKI